MGRGDGQGLNFFQELRRRRVFRVAGLYIVAAWVVIQVADVAFPGWGIPESAIRYVILGALSGFPLALVFGWRYDITMAGIVRTVPEKDLSEAPDLSLRRFDYLVLAALAVVVVLGVVGVLHETFEERSTTAVHPNSVAVLPFDDMSAEADQQYFSDGISEEILNLLARNPDLRVAARTSSFSLRDKDLDVPAIGERLRVEHVVEGSVRKSGERLRITAQLIEADTGYNLWTDTYETVMGEIFAVQDAIATQIVEALGRRLASVQPAGAHDSMRPTDDPEAYEMYLLGRHYWRQRGEGNIRTAIGIFQDVIQRDPDFARAWAALASAYITLPVYVQDRRDARGAHTQALEAAERALALDSSLGEAHLVLAQMDKNQKRWNAAEEHYLRGIELSPAEPTASYWYGEFLSAMGRMEDSRQALFRAADLDPLAANIQGDIGWSYLQGTPDASAVSEAEARFLQGWNMGLQAMFIWFGQFIVYIERGDYDAAWKWLERKTYPVGLDADRAFVDAMRKPSEANVARAVEEMKKALEVREALPRTAVVYYGYLGQTDLALEMLEVAVNTFDPRVLWAPGGDDYRDDPRYIELVEKLGLPENWERFGWSKFCRKKGDRLNCS